ncbi:hypothetical protein ACFVHW_28945 [Streptomyces sp. NPDC127110]|uniref:hypothetical protein n=1 Tax=Streptomyces sp. NPDC127110 TaxID=3345362 RepID=UPI003633374D
MEKRLKSWGNNRAGQLGEGTSTDFRTTATTVLGLTSAEVVKVAAGGSSAAAGHGLALLTDGTVQSWGSNGSGQLGDGSVFSHNAPGQVVNVDNARDIAAGGAHSLAWRTGPSWPGGVTTTASSATAPTAIPPSRSRSRA